MEYAVSSLAVWPLYYLQYMQLSPCSTVISVFTHTIAFHSIVGHVWYCNVSDRVHISYTEDMILRSKQVSSYIDMYVCMCNMPHTSSRSEEAKDIASQMIGHQLHTKQTGAVGRPCRKVCTIISKHSCFGQVLFTHLQYVQLCTVSLKMFFTLCVVCAGVGVREARAGERVLLCSGHGQIFHGKNQPSYVYVHVCKCLVVSSLSAP